LFDELNVRFEARNVADAYPGHTELLKSCREVVSEAGSSPLPTVFSSGSVHIMNKPLPVSQIVLKKRFM
jgi:hypothetical protein